VEVFGLDKFDIVVLVVEGHEDCTKPLALVKKFFDARVIRRKPRPLGRGWGESF
jgi:chromosome partitioning protein